MYVVQSFFPGSVSKSETLSQYVTFGFVSKMQLIDIISAWGMMIVCESYEPCKRVHDACLSCQTRIGWVVYDARFVCVSLTVGHE